MTTAATITVSERDYQQLMKLIESIDTPAAEALDEELSRADVVPTRELPSDIVAMGSKVSFRDLDNGEETTVTLVYPREANVDRMCISVLSPVGSALIGLRTGGTIDWPLPGGKFRRLEVTAVEQAEDPF